MCRCDKPLACSSTLHCSSSLSCMNEYVAIESGGYLCMKSLCINCSIARCLPVNPREVQILLDWAGLPGCKVHWAAMRTRYYIIYIYMNLPLLSVLFTVCTYVICLAHTPTTPQKEQHTQLQAYNIPYCRTQYRQMSFFPQTIPEWNSLPQEIVATKSLDCFKSRLAAHL